MKKNLFFTLIIILAYITATSQNNTKFIDTGSVKNQFNFLIDKSNSYQDFKVIKATWLKELKTNINDTLLANKAEILTNYNTITSQKKLIDSLNTALTDSKKNIETLTNNRDSIAFLGIQFNKTTFKNAIVITIGILIALLVFFILKFKQSNSITEQTKLSLKEIETEFEEHRKVAIEREQKVRRQLQDELNKHKKDS